MISRGFCWLWMLEMNDGSWALVVVEERSGGGPGFQL